MHKAEIMASSRPTYLRGRISLARVLSRRLNVMARDAGVQSSESRIRRFVLVFEHGANEWWGFKPVW
jgi:hypothetical protein